MIWLAICLAAAIAFLLAIMGPGAPAGSPMGFCRTLIGDGSYRYEIAGGHDCQQNLKEIAGNDRYLRDHECSAVLVPDASHPSDRWAIQVQVNGRTVGYIPRTRAQEIHKALKGAPARVGALITGGWMSDERGEAHFGVRLDILRPIQFEY